MKNPIVGLLLAIISFIFTAGCSTTPKQVYLGDMNDGGIHAFSQAPEKWILIYNRRVLDATAKDIQKMDLAYRKAGVAIEHLGNIKEVAKQNGITDAELEKILAVAYWDTVEKKHSTYVSTSYGSGGYYRSSGGSFGYTPRTTASSSTRRTTTVRSGGGGTAPSSGGSFGYRSLRSRGQ